jgi:UDP-2-acetamido-3-amino-2,3-dideoxy-glucuronate N-acetyltransferase
MKFTVKGDSRGSLIAIESNRDIPFEIRRVYYIFGTKSGVTRGLHAHKTLRQVLICVSGSCTIVLDNGKAQSEVFLSNPSEGLYVGPGIWREMKDFSEDAVLLVLASDYYDEQDYIRNYEDFLKFVELHDTAR